MSDDFVELTPQPDNFDPREIENLIQEVDDMDDYISILVYGVSGVGKTRFGATGDKVLLINCNEQKPISIRGTGSKVITVRRVPDDTEKIFWYLRNGGHKNFNTVVIDGLSSLQKMYERRVVSDESKLNKDKHKIIVTQRDYGIVNNYMFVDIMNFRNLQDSMNVVFLALEREPDEKNDRYRPDLTPGSTRAVESAVNIIARMTLEEVTVKGKDLTLPVQYYGPHTECVTKDCTGKLGQRIFNPTIPKILEKIYK